MSKIAGGIICIVLLIGFGGAITTGLHTWRTDDISQTAVVTTGEAETTGDVILTRELFAGNVSEIHTLSSSISETPITGTYVAATDTLTITNLTASQTRTLTLGYYSEKEDEYLQIIGPFLAFFIFGGIIAAIIWYIWKGNNSSRRRG